MGDLSYLEMYMKKTIYIRYVYLFKYSIYLLDIQSLDICTSKVLNTYSVDIIDRRNYKAKKRGKSPKERFFLYLRYVKIVIQKEKIEKNRMAREYDNIYKVYIYVVHSTNSTTYE